MKMRTHPQVPQFSFILLFFKLISNYFEDEDADFHGTSVAGVAAARNNSDCGVGSAYQAEIAGIRLTAKASTDADRATALSYRYSFNLFFFYIINPTHFINNSGIMIMIYSLPVLLLLVPRTQWAEEVQ